jgi:hypothetical protein
MSVLAFQFWSGLILACAGSFYAGYQRGRRIQTVADTAARSALIEIVERLGDEQLSGLGRDIRNTALKGLK